MTTSIWIPTNPNSSWRFSVKRPDSFPQSNCCKATERHRCIHFVQEPLLGIYSILGVWKCICWEHTEENEKTWENNKKYQRCKPRHLPMLHPWQLPQSPHRRRPARHALPGLAWNFKKLQSSNSLAALKENHKTIIGAVQVYPSNVEWSKQLHLVQAHHLRWNWNKEKGGNDIVIIRWMPRGETHRNIQCSNTHQVESVWTCLAGNTGGSSR